MRLYRLSKAAQSLRNTVQHISSEHPKFHIQYQYIPYQYLIRIKQISPHLSNTNVNHHGKKDVVEVRKSLLYSSLDIWGRPFLEDLLK